MAQKDYVRRGKNARRKKSHSQRSQGASTLLIGFAVLVLLVFIGGLYFLTSHHKTNDSSANDQSRASASGKAPSSKANSNALPPKPEERWRYIKELENPPPNPSLDQSDKPVVNNNEHRQLTDEQRQLLEQIQADMRQQPTKLNEVPWNEQPAANSAPVASAANAPSASRQAAVQPPPALPQSATAAKPPPAPAPSGRRWLVQCGSFKNAQQAEEVRAQLAFAGFTTHISASDGWQRVVMGPFSDKTQADGILVRLKNEGHNQCIRLAIGG